MKNQKILILGNGFDLSLGLKTTSSQFAISNYWPNINSHALSPLALKIEEEKNKNLDWFNLEDSLYDYARDREIDEHLAIERLFGSPELDEHYLNDLSVGLTEFIKQEQNKELNPNSHAAMLLKAVTINNDFTKIYSFNYTDIRLLAKRLGINIRDSVECINTHGRVDKDNIVLGVSSSSKLMDGYDSFKKTNNLHYEDSDLLSSLIDSNEVIVFGHSFGSQDYAYFKDYISLLSNPDFCHSHKMTVITKDDQSLNSIKRHIEKQGMITDLTPLLNYGSFRTIKTSKCTDDEYNYFVNTVANSGVTGEYHISFIQNNCVKTHKN